MAAGQFGDFSSSMRRWCRPDPAVSGRWTRHAGAGARSTARSSDQIVPVVVAMEPVVDSAVVAPVRSYIVTPPMVCAV